jgi:hypothetical protein
MAEGASDTFTQRQQQQQRPSGAHSRPPPALWWPDPALQHPTAHPTTGRLGYASTPLPLPSQPDASILQQ